MLLHQQKLGRVINYIQSNLDKTVSTETLSKIAHISVFHFHRIFLADFGITVGQYVKLSKFKQASYLLAFRHEFSVLDIALACGYASAASLSREFKRILGISPSAFRKSPNWEQWQHCFEQVFPTFTKPLHSKKGNNMLDNNLSENVRMIDFSEIQVAVLEHKGSPHRVMQTVGNFIQWRRVFGPSPKISDTFNILYHDPAEVPADEYRMDICAAITMPVKPNEYGVIEKIIPAGRCAVLRHLGSDNHLASSIDYLYSQWLTNSGESLRDFPCFIKRVAFYPDVAEHESIIDIYLPIK